MRAIRSLFPLAGVTAWIVTFVVTVNILAFALDGTSFLRWLPERSTGVGFLLESKQRVAAAQAAYQSGMARDGKYLAAIVGISNVREGVSIDTLTEAHSDRWRFIGVAGAGAGVPSTAEQAELVLSSNLRPDLVVLGISPMHLLDPLVDPIKSRAIAGRSAPQNLIEQVKSNVWQSSCLINTRTDLRPWFDRRLMDIRSAAQTIIGVDATSQDSRSPWRPMLRTLKETTPTDKAIESGLAWARSFSANDLKAYEQSRQGPHVGAKIIRDFTARGACVVVLMMPEHSRLRALEPTGVDRFVEDRLRSESGMRGLSIVNLRDAVADSQFNDLVHLNGKGSATLSVHLAQAIDRLAITGPPLMASPKSLPSRQQNCRHVSSRST